jgi:hypothetical protein
MRSVPSSISVRKRRRTVRLHSWAVPPRSKRARSVSLLRMLRERGTVTYTKVSGMTLPSSTCASVASWNERGHVVTGSMSAAAFSLNHEASSRRSATLPHAT